MMKISSPSASIEEKHKSINGFEDEDMKGSCFRSYTGVGGSLTSMFIPKFSFIKPNDLKEDRHLLV